MGDVEMEDLAALMGQDQEDIQHAKSGRRDAEKIDGDQLFGVGVQEGLPGLRWRPGSAREPK